MQHADRHERRARGPIDEGLRVLLIWSEADLVQELLLRAPSAHLEYVGIAQIGTAHGQMRELAAVEQARLPAAERVGHERGTRAVVAAFGVNLDQPRENREVELIGFELAASLQEQFKRQVVVDEVRCLTNPTAELDVVIVR